MADKVAAVKKKRTPRTPSAVASARDSFLKIVDKRIQEVVDVAGMPASVVAPVLYVEFAALVHAGGDPLDLYREAMVAKLKRPAVVEVA